MIQPVCAESAVKHQSTDWHCQSAVMPCYQ